MIFSEQPLRSKSILQRLFRQEPVENAIIELNNLLASKLPLSITIDQVKAIERKYALKLATTFPLNLHEFYAVRWNDWLKTGVSDVPIEQELAHLADLFSLTNTDQLIQLIGESWYLDKMQQVLQKKHVSPIDETDLEMIRVHVRLNQQTAVYLFDMGRLTILETAAAPFINRERLSPTDETSLMQLASNLRYSAPSLFKKLAPYKYYWQLENLPLQLINTNGQLQKSEQCYFEAKQVKWLETRSAGRGYSQLEHVNYGTLYLTNKRLVFEGNTKNSTLPYDRIRGISKKPEGVQLQKDKGKDPILKLTSHEVAFTIILKRLIS